MNHNIPSWYIPTEEVELGHSACDACGVDLPEERDTIGGKKYCADHITEAPKVSRVKLNNYRTRCIDCGATTNHVLERKRTGPEKILGPKRKAVCADCGQLRGIPVNNRPPLPSDPDHIEVYRGGSRGR